MRRRIDCQGKGISTTLQKTTLASLHHRSPSILAGLAVKLDGLPLPDPSLGLIAPRWRAKRMLPPPGPIPDPPEELPVRRAERRYSGPVPSRVSALRSQPHPRVPRGFSTTRRSGVRRFARLLKMKAAFVTAPFCASMAPTLPLVPAFAGS